MTLDAYASLSHYASHILPVWLALPREIRGHFYGPQHEQAWGPQYQPGNRCLVASRVDAQKVAGRYIYLEHGAGQSYCLAPETRVLTTEMRWVPISRLRLGDELVAFDETPSDRVWRKWQTASVTETRLLRLPSYRLHMADGTTIVASADHKWLTRDRQTYEWSTTKNLQDAARWPTRSSKLLKPFDTWDEDTSWGAGYLAAAFDGEGSFTQTCREPRQNRTMLMFCQKENDMLDLVRAEIAHRGFRFSVNKNEQSGVYRLAVLGGSKDVLRFMGSIRPRRLLANMSQLQNGQMRGDPVELVRLEFLGDQTVIGLGTSTGTFIAEGFASHNSGDPFSARNSSYAGGYDRSLERADLFIGPGHRVVERWAEVSEAPAVAVGCPYLDWWHTPRARRHRADLIGRERTVAFTFHWSAENVCQEAWPALDHYESALEAVVSDLRRSGVTVIGHGHPRAAARLKRIWRSMGVPWVCREQVFDHADVLVADNTSLGWEAATLGVRLVWLNAPWYRKEVEHGLRFWQWADSGLQVDEPGDLVDAIRAQLAGDAAPSREDAVMDTYAACDGHASERAAAAIRTVIGD